MPNNDDLKFYDAFSQQLTDVAQTVSTYEEADTATSNHNSNQNGASNTPQSQQTVDNTSNNDNSSSSVPTNENETTTTDTPSNQNETSNTPQSQEQNNDVNNNSSSPTSTNESETNTTTNYNTNNNSSNNTPSNNTSPSGSNSSNTPSSVGGHGGSQSPATSNNSSHNESSYTNQVATNYQLSIGKQLDGISNALNQPAPNSTAAALNVAEAGVQAFGLVMGLTQNLVEGAMLPIFAAIGMKGMASLPISKQMDPVMGIDIHMVTIPPSPLPIPMPHPYVGMLFRAKDFLSIAAAYLLPPPPPPPTLPENPSDPEIAAANFAKALALGNSVASIAISMIGATVAVGTFPRAVAGTPTKSIPHFPMGTGFHPAFSFVAKNHGHAFMGSLLALADDDPISGGTPHMHFSCNDVGTISPHTLRPSKNTSDKKEVRLQLFLPTSVITPIPPGKPILTNPLPVPFNPVSAIAKKINAAFGRFLKKAFKKILQEFNRKVLKRRAMQNFGPTKKLSDFICRKIGDPVDIATGVVHYTSEDFTLPGPYPIVWEKTWYSDSEYEGILGSGFHCSYDLALHVVPKDDLIALRLSDGRMAVFPILYNQEESIINRHQKIELKYIDSETYEVLFIDSLETYTFKKVNKSMYRPIKAKNNQGFEIKFSYGWDNKLEQIIDAVGREINLTSNGSGYITEVKAKYKGTERTLVKYEYDNGDLVKITDALNKSTTIGYQNHLMTRKTDRNGQSFYWKYDGDKVGAKCIKTWGDEGILNATLSFHKGYTITTNSLGHQSRYDVDENGLITKITDPYGNEKTFQYNQHSELIAETDEEGNTTRYDYDRIGNLTSIVMPDNTAIGYQYDESMRLTQTLYPAGGVASRIYTDDKLSDVISFDGNITSFEYNEKGLISEVRDANGKETFLEYDEDYNLSKMILPDEAAVQWAYDEWGRCAKTINAEGHQQQFIYDELDRIQKIQQADSNVIDLKYNAYDEVIALKDKQRNVNFEYTPLGSLKMREENGVKVHFEYDTEEDLLLITNEHEEKYSFTRDKKGDIITESGFDDLTRFYKRDRAGKVVKVRRPGDKFTEYEYDLNGRITRAEHSDDTWETFTYNPDGALIEATNPNSLVELIRDPSGKITKEIQNDYEVESTYDSLGNRIKITSSLGANIDIERDDMGLVSQMSVAVESQENENQQSPENQQAWTAKFNYNSLGMEVERMLPGGIVSTFEYDQAGRPIRQKVSAGNRELRHRTYKWNVNDRLTTMVNQLTSGKVTYTHDDFGNLASAQYENGNLDYKLPDEVGNLYRTEKKKDRKYGKGSQLLEADGKRFEYDDEGNLIRKITPKGTWQYDWYGNGMLKSVDCPTGQDISFEYDALGRRTAKIIRDTAFDNTEPNGKITRFIWDGNVPLHEWSYALKDRPKWVVDTFGFLAKDREEPVNQLITWVFDEGTFKPAAKIMDGEQYSIITDYLGTPVEMYNSKGEKTWQVEYDIYGKVRKLIKGNPAACPFRYQGQYEDVETGLYYNRFRYYSADEGRYISQDPIGIESDEYNFYSYVVNSNTWVDPFGLVKAPASLPNEPGIYIITNGKDSYVGSSGIGKQGMNDRISSSSHQHAQDLLKKPGTKVQYVRVDLGTATSGSDRNNILRHYEEIENIKQKKRGFNMLNDAGIQDPKKKKLTERLIKKHGASAKKRRTTCK